jgi:hypothetical protein
MDLSFIGSIPKFANFIGPQLATPLSLLRVLSPK